MGRTATSAPTDDDRGRDTEASGAPSPARRSLQQRILSSVRPLTLIPVLVIGSLTLGALFGLARAAERSLERSSETVAQDVAGQTVRTGAVTAMREIDQALAERIADVRALAASPMVRATTRRAAVTAPGDTLTTQQLDELEAQYGETRRLLPTSVVDRYLTTTAQDQPQVGQLLVTERSGLSVAASGRPAALVNADEEWWNRAWRDGLYIGDVEQDDAVGGPSLTVAARVSSGGEGAGVVKAAILLDELQRIATGVADDTGTDIAILAGDGQLVAETASDHDPARILSGDTPFDGELATAATTALDSGEPGVERSDAVLAGYAPLATDGRVADVLDRADGGPAAWVALAVEDDPAAFAPVGGLANISEGLTSTAWTFAVLILLVLVASLVATVLVSRRLADSIVGPLRTLGATARDIADHRLPALVARAQDPSARRGDVPDLPAVQLDTGDEIEEVADAFTIVSGTAADLAAEQARSRRNVARMFVNLGRRNQNLLSRQMRVIDQLERDTSDPDTLDGLFRLDHLATRMRRNAESLLVLAGHQPSRRWSEPVSLTEVVRGAIAEVEDYQRVSLDDVDEARLTGGAVGDVTHLLAELIENATQFSPPDTRVAVVGRRVVDGYALAVVDDGVGMSAEQMDDANQRIDMSPLVDRVPSSFLGLYVVGRLAARHGIQVRLVESTTQGVTAKVLLPESLINEAQRGVPRRDLGTLARPAPAGDHDPAPAGPSDHDSPTSGVAVPAVTAAAADQAAAGAPLPATAAADAGDAEAAAGADDAGAAAGTDDAGAAAGTDDAGSGDAGVDDGTGGALPVATAAGGDDSGADEPGAGAAGAGATAGVGAGPPHEDAVGARRHRTGAAEPSAGGAPGRADTGDAPATMEGTPAGADDIETDEIDVQRVRAAAAGAAASASVDRTDAPARSTGDAPSSSEGAGIGNGAHAVGGAGPADDTSAANGSRAAAVVHGDPEIDAAASERPVAATPDRPEVADGEPGATDDASDDEPPALEVRRRTSRRPSDSPGDGPNGGHDGGIGDRAVLRPARSGGGTRAAEPASEPAPRAPSAPATDEQGVPLTRPEREARAARDRLRRFQQAVQRGRTQAKSRHNGGDQRDA